MDAVVRRAAARSGPGGPRRSATAATAVTTGAVVVGALTAVGLAAPVAAADNTSWNASVSPTTVAPGGTVTLSSSGCQVPSVTADSAVFDTQELNEGNSATTRVFEDAKPGAEYEVTFTCDGQTRTVPLMISSGGSHNGNNNTLHRGVKAGEGGAWESFSPGRLVLGGLLVAGVLAYTVRRARASTADE